MEISSRPPRQESGVNSPRNDCPTPPLTPKPISRSDATPYPTTFVQADTSSFKQVVQMLTGSSETAKNASKSDPPSSKGGGFNIPPKKQGFKAAALYERRNSLKNGLMINPLIPGGLVTNSANSGYCSPRKPEILSPSILDFPSLALSPVTPLNEDPFNKSSPSMGNSSSSSEEDKAIAEKKFYLHPSPRTTTPRDSQPPMLLPLFPVTSPRVSGGSSSS